MELPTTLINGSTLTETQVESLVSYLKVASHETTLKQAAESRSPRPVKVGSFYRTVQQGRENVRASILTVVLAQWIGLVRAEDLNRLFDQLGQGLSGLEEGERDQVASVIGALVTRIVT